MSTAEQPDCLKQICFSLSVVTVDDVHALAGLYYFIDLNPDPKLTEIARCITARHDSGISNRKAEHSGVFVESTNITDDEKFAVAFVEPNGEVHIGRIRKLTPRECWRLQGFTDEQFNKAKATGLSDSRLYKMAGNAVTVNVIAEIGKIIKKVDESAD